MLDWTKLLQIKTEAEDDVPQAIRKLLESIPNNMLLSIHRKSIERGHLTLLKYIEEERQKRNL